MRILLLNTDYQRFHADDRQEFISLFGAALGFKAKMPRVYSAVDPPNREH